MRVNDTNVTRTGTGVDLTMETRISLTIEQIAAAFCELDDDQQALFFVECGRIAATWRAGVAQFYAVGRHLRTCACASYEGRQIISDLFAGLNDGKD